MQNRNRNPPPISTLRKKTDPVLVNPRQVHLFSLAQELLTQHKFGEKTYRNAVPAFGERGMVEIVAING